MVKKLICSILFFCCLTSMSQGFANSETFVLNSNQGNKIYLSADQMVISEKGIFILLENENLMLTKVLVPQLSCDENGLFILAEHIPSRQALERCGNFHPLTCAKCWGCSRNDCEFRCKCKR